MEPATYLNSRIWLEEPEPNNPFAARAAYCHGYDVFRDMLGRSGWVDMIYLLFRGEAPSRNQAASLEVLAVALANAGPRDPAVHAAMCAGVGGAPAAAALTAALAVGAGGAGGAREVWRAMRAWATCGPELSAWQRYWTEADAAREASPDVWPVSEHPAGFDALGVETATPVRLVLGKLAELSPGSRCAWLLANLAGMEAAAGHPLALVGAAAAAFVDLGFDPEQGEMLFLLLRLPGAAAHALEQRESGHKRFPFYALEMEDVTSGATP